MRSEAIRDRGERSGATALPCPACGGPIAVDGCPVLLHQIACCRGCERRFHVVSVEPLVFEVFRSHGLALVDD